MLIEAHITVSYPPQSEAALHTWLASHAMKLTCVELSQGVSPRQNMITTQWDGSLDDAIRDASSVRRSLEPLGISASRIKLETAHSPNDSLVPALYIEHHIKVRTFTERLTEVEQLGVVHGAHLSRNPHRHVGELEERFLTQRFRTDGTDLATSLLGALLDALQSSSVSIAKIERERVIYDDNLLLDAGWAPELTP